MFLQSLEIENLRSIKRLHLDFGGPENPRPMTLLLGENGTGKSTVLRAIALVTVGSEGLFELMETPSSWVHNKADSAHIGAVLVTKDGEKRDVSFVIKKGATRAETLRQNQEGLALLDAAVTPPRRNYFVVGYGASRRLGSASLSSSSAYPDQRAANVRTLFDRNAQLNPLETWAMDLDYSQAEEGHDTLGVIREVLANFLPDVVFSHIDKRRKRLIFGTPDGEVGLEQLSDGYQSVAGWIGDLLYNISRSHADFRKPLEARGLLLLDEIGLHLHPAWQRKLLSAIRTHLPNFQVVATSHSPLIVGSLHREEVVVLERSGGEIRVRLPEQSPYGLTVDQILASPIFGLSNLRDDGFERSLDQVRSKANQGDVKAAIKLSRMLALGEEWQVAP